MALPAARKITGHGIRVMISAHGVFWLPAGKLAEGGAAFAGHAGAFPSRLGQPQEFADPLSSTVANPKQNRSSAET